MRVSVCIFTAIVAATGCVSVAMAEQTQRKELAMSDLGMEHGFRNDPMQWAENNTSLQGALVRLQILQTSRAGDTELIKAEIDKILAGQLPDGRLSDDEKQAMQFTAERLIRLAELGCPSDRAEVKKAVAE